MKLITVKNYDEMSKVAADIIADQVNKKPNSVLGLATGGTPEGMYALLAKMPIDWNSIKTFNLDEYIGIPSEHEMSYRTYMNNNLFNKIDINITNTFVPSGQGDIEKNGIEYDRMIDEEGGIDLQVLGIGENAHIAFNEPGSDPKAGTREVKLTDETIQANSRYFASKDDVPKTAISMGIASILKAKKIILLASGPKKAEAIRLTIEGEISKDVPSSFLRNHPDVTIIADEAATKTLSENAALACACD